MSVAPLPSTQVGNTSYYYDPVSGKIGSNTPYNKPMTPLNAAVVPNAPASSYVSVPSSAIAQASPGVTPTTLTGVPAPAAAQSPASQASTPATATTTSATTDSILSNILASLSSGGNATPAGSGMGVGASDTSLPSSTAADVAALQPSATPTSSSGPNIGLIIGIVLVLGLGVYLWFQHKKKGGSPIGESA
jgi:cobalamin biosynthesis Mg chelatase CobN